MVKELGEEKGPAYPARTEVVLVVVLVAFQKHHLQVAIWKIDCLVIILFHGKIFTLLLSNGDKFPNLVILLCGLTN